MTISIKTPNILINFCKNSNKQIFIMPAGGHAIKAMKYLKEHNIQCSYFIDNDPEKQGKYIDGIKVLSYEEFKLIKENANVIIATNPEVHQVLKKDLDCLNVENIWANQEFYFYNIDEIDNSAFYINKHKEEYDSLYNILADELSKKTLKNIIEYRCSGFENIDLINEIKIPTATQYFEDDIYKITPKDSIVDCGAYIGDTLDICLKKSNGRVLNYYAFEPDAQNFNKLKMYENDFISCYNLGCYSDDKTLYFTTNKSDGSHITDDGDCTVKVVKLDSTLKNKPVSYIKMDIEGAEIEALKGAKNIIQKQEPTLAICLYHQFNDLWQIPQIIKSFGVNYKYYLRHYGDYTTETVLYAVKEDGSGITKPRVNSYMMTREPLVSVMLPTYNRKDLANKAIESVLNQTYKNIELIISDNHSTDGTEEMCREYLKRDGRIKYYRQEKNIGMINNCNFTMSKLSGEYFIFFCDDDWLDIDYIEKCIKFLHNNPDYVLVHPTEYVYDSDGNFIKENNSIDLEGNVAERFRQAFINNTPNNFVNGLSRTCLLREIYEYDKQYMQDRYADDVIFLLKFIAAGKCKVIRNTHYNKLNTGATGKLETTSIDYWDIEGLNKQNFDAVVQGIIVNAITKDNFFKAYMNKQEFKQTINVVRDLFKHYYAHEYTLKEIFKLLRPNRFNRKALKSNINILIEQYKNFIQVHKFIKKTEEAIIKKRDSLQNIIDLPPLEALSEPLVSVMLPTYNRKELTKKAIDSVLNQTYKNIELIISDNHSTDGTEQMCREYLEKDTRIRYYRQEKNIGMMKNCSFAMSQAKGDYFVFFCDDDWLDLDYVKKSLDFLKQNPDYSIVTPSARLYNDDYELKKECKPIDLTGNVLNRLEKSIKHNFLNDYVNGLTRTGILRQIYVADNDYLQDRYADDVILQLKFVTAGKCKILNDTHYNKVDAGKTRQLGMNAEGYWDDTGITIDNYFETVAKIVSKAILTDNFFKLYIPKKKLPKVAIKISETFMKHNAKVSSGKLMGYIWRHPFFAFRKDFWKMLIDENNILDVIFIKYKAYKIVKEIMKNDK